MTKVQAVTIPYKPAAKQPPKRMYRGILMAQAIEDVFVRATSDSEANELIARGKGQRMKPRFGEWQVWQEAISVSTYERSNIPPQAIPLIARGFTEQELRKIYIKVLHDIFGVRARGAYTDEEQQAMADAV